jgi:hypothetical protein
MAGRPDLNILAQQEVLVDSRQHRAGRLPCQCGSPNWLDRNGAADGACDHRHLEVPGYPIAVSSGAVAVVCYPPRVAVCNLMAMSAHSDRLDQFEGGNAAGGHARKMGAIGRSLKRYTSPPRLTTGIEAVAGAISELIGAE